MNRAGHVSAPPVIHHKYYQQQSPITNTSSTAIHTIATPFLTGVQSAASDIATGNPNIKLNIINWF